MYMQNISRSKFVLIVYKMLKYLFEQHSAVGFLAILVKKNLFHLIMSSLAVLVTGYSGTTKIRLLRK